MRHSHWILALACCGIMPTGFAAQRGDLDQPHVAGQFIVRFADQSRAKTSRALDTLGATPLRRFQSSGAVLASLNGDRDDDALGNTLRALRARKDVVYAEPNYIQRMERLPNDPRFSEQWGLRNLETAGGHIHAERAWDITTGSRDVIVGIIDSGIDADHPDLAPNIWTNPGESGLDANGVDRSKNGIDDDKNGFIDDWRGWNFLASTNDASDDNHHGTHCAGIVGAVGDDGRGVTGVNWRVSLLPLKFLDSEGSGSTDDAIRAIEYATYSMNPRPTILSASWGSFGASEALAEAIGKARDAGILFVAAAGNAGLNSDITGHYPSGFDIDNIIAVGASDAKDEIAEFSNYGRRSVDLTAPGVDILSTLPRGEYDLLSGTSMAAPHVAGVAALIKAAFPGIGYHAMRARILAKVDPVPGLASLVATGGRLNAVGALDPDVTPPARVDAVLQTHPTLDGFVIEWNGVGDDGLEGSATRYELRVSDSSLTTAAQWDAAATPTWETIPVAATEMGRQRLGARVSKMPLGYDGYVTIRAFDDVGNESTLSTSIRAHALDSQSLRLWDAESMDGITPTGRWGLERARPRDNAFSDSPNDRYAPRSYTTLTFPRVDVDPRGIALRYETRVDVQLLGDFCSVWVSADDENWVEVDRYAGTRSWHYREVNLSRFLGDAPSFRFRFALTSDASIEADGCIIDNVSLWTPKE